MHVPAGAPFRKSGQHLCSSVGCVVMKIHQQLSQVPPDESSPGEGVRLGRAWSPDREAIIFAICATFRNAQHPFN
jgi:hypothetical protein